MSRPYFGVKTKGAAKERREGGERGRRRCKRGNSKEGIAMEHTVLLIEVV
jgi:hypothetical protein